MTVEGEKVSDNYCLGFKKDTDMNKYYDEIKKIEEAKGHKDFKMDCTASAYKLFVGFALSILLFLF